MGLKNYFKREPVWASMVGLSAASWVGTWLVTRGIVSNTQASSLTQALAPALAAGVLLGAGLVLRELVTPAWKVAEAKAEAWVAKEMPAELPALKAIDSTVDSILADASAYGDTVPVALSPEGPVYPPQEAQGATNPGGDVSQVPPADPIAPGSPQKPMSAGQVEDDPGVLPGAGVTVEGQLTAELGGLA